MSFESLIEQMSLREKVGQLFLLAFSKDRLDEARVLFADHFVGASYISNDNIPTAEAAASLTAQIQGYAAGTRLGIPLLLGVDQEGAWSVMTPGSSTGPGNMALGATGDPEQAYRMYKVIGEELKAAGLNVLLAPCADCNSNPNNVGIGMRSFGESPDLVGAMTFSAVRGARDGGVIATVKHFPGHGDTTLDSHRGLPSVSRNRDDLFAIDLKPFADGIRAGAEIVMTAHILFPALDPDNPATLSKIILQDVLRGEMGFDGLILSDSMNMKSMKLNYDPAESAVRAINAGVDLIMLAEEHYDHDAVNYLRNQTALIDAVVAAVENGTISQERLDDAVRRNLRLKDTLGTVTLQPETVGSAAHREVELDVSRKAIAVLNGKVQIPIIPSDMKVVLVNTTKRAAYDVLGSTRGIGPNQVTPAFDTFAEAMRARFAQVDVISEEDAMVGSFVVPEGAQVIAVTENYALPGMDFDKSSQRQVVEGLSELVGDALIVVALRDPYELADLPESITYVCAFSFRPSAAEAAADALAGRIDSLTGTSPVSF